jgi:hypothetical protein
MPSEYTLEIGVDLDGTLAEYDTWKGFAHIGKPVPRMVTKVKRALAKGYKVYIFTARASEVESLPYIEDWCLKHLGVVLPITAVKLYTFDEYWDDRAVGIEKNTGQADDPYVSDTIWRSLG